MLTQVSVPPEYCDHPSIKHGVFCALPAELWELLLQELEEKGFDDRQLKMELAIAAACGEMTKFVGFWRSVPIDFDLLRSRPVSIPASIHLGWQLNPAQIALREMMAQQRLGYFWTTSRAYAGWLLSQRQFIAEHDNLLSQWSDAVGRWGFPARGPSVTSGEAPPQCEIVEERQIREFSDAFEAFYVRWRLRGMAAPYLPIPLTPQMSGVIPAASLGHLASTGGLFYLPDTFPVPSRDLLLGLLEDSLHGDTPSEHLAGWVAIVRRENSAKNEIHRLSRQFEVQHYWRVLRQRHAFLLHRNHRRIRSCLAIFLDSTERSIKRDLARIAESLGADWAESKPRVV